MRTCKRLHFTMLDTVVQAVRESRFRGRIPAIDGSYFYDALFIAVVLRRQTRIGIGVALSVRSLERQKGFDDEKR